MKIYDAAVGGSTKLEAAQRYHKVSGLYQHKNDQDRRVFEPHRQLFAVADGVGGSRDGAAAAEAACDMFIRRMPLYPVTTKMALRAIHDYVYPSMREAVYETGSQTTFTGMTVTTDGNLVYMHAGDSKLLRIRDNTLISPVSAQHAVHDHRRLSNALGVTRDQPLAQVNIPSHVMTEYGTLSLMHGDRVALATDGIGRRQYMDEPLVAEGWWLSRLRRHLGEDALDRVNSIVFESDIIDDSSVILVDIA